MRIDEVIMEARELVVPDRGEEEALMRLAGELVERLERLAMKSPSRPKVELGGSLAKGTWLKGDADIDIFLKFPKGIDRRVMEEEGIAIGMEALKGHGPYLRYADQPYVECSIGGVKVDVVCCYDVEEGEWVTVADRSPYHVRLVSGMGEELKNEVRLLKKFMKGIGAYGAELSVQGFSGFVCEVLIMKYGSFLKAIEALSMMAEGEVIGSKGRGPLGLEAPINIIDPVDPKRNLGIAISEEALSKAILASRTFLKRPGIEFFLPREPRIDEVRASRLLDSLVVVLFRHSKRSPDVLWGQLKRSLRKVVKGMRMVGFDVAGYTCSTNEMDESAIALLILNKRLPSLEIGRGPSIFMKEGSESFLNKNRGSMLWIEGSRMYVVRERRVKGIWDYFDTLRSTGIGIAKGLVKEFMESSELYEGEDAVRLAESRPWLLRSLYDLMVRDERLYGRP